jgi:hypothetical protein
VKLAPFLSEPPSSPLPKQERREKEEAHKKQHKKSKKGLKDNNKKFGLVSNAYIFCRGRRLLNCLALCFCWWWW